MVDFDKIWVEKYRPHTLDDIILDERTLSVVKEFDSISDFIDSDHKYVVPENYLECFEKSKVLFKMHRDKLNPDELPFVHSTQNIADLMKYLIHDCNISEKRVYTAIKKMQNVY